MASCNTSPLRSRSVLYAPCTMSNHPSLPPHRRRKGCSCCSTSSVSVRLWTYRVDVHFSHHRCPILFKLDLLSIIERMTRVGAHSHALATCLLLPPALKSSTLQVTSYCGYCINILCLQSVLSGLPYNSLLSLLDEVTESSSTELSLVRVGHISSSLTLFSLRLLM